MVNRRSVLAALPTAAFITSSPLAAQPPAERVVLLMRELSAALSEYFDGTFRAIVDPSNLPGGTFMLQSAGLTSPSEGMMYLTLNGRPLTVDTNDIPEVWQVQDEDAPHLKAWVSQPDSTDLYLIIGRHGTLEVSSLSQTTLTWLPHDPRRTGSVEWTEAGPYNTKCRQTVRIIGKVIDA